MLRKLGERTVSGLWNRIGSLVDIFRPAECVNYFSACGYDPDWTENALERPLGNGEQWGILLSYAEQPSPDSIAQAFNIGAAFLHWHPSALVLGDNIFRGHGLSELLRNADAGNRGATVFSYHVVYPERYGVVAFDASSHAMDIEEKPAAPKSSWAVAGFCFFDEDLVEIARSIRPRPEVSLR
jgi:glucose-1-phosphate thymidylyltransferase